MTDSGATQLKGTSGGTLIESELIHPVKRRFNFNPALILGIPYLGFLIVFGVVPVILAIIFSFSKYGGFRPEYLTAGFSNYKAIFTDPQFLKSFGNIFKFALISLPVSFVGALGVALILNLAEDGLGRFMRTVYFVPGAITLSAVALIAIFMFDPGVSPFGFILKWTGARTAGDIINNKTLIPFLVLVRFFAFAGGWVAIFFGGGYFFGNIPFVQENLEFLVLGIIAVTLAPSAYHAIKLRLQQRRAVAEEVELIEIDDVDGPA